MAGYNITRSLEELLRKHEASPPSLIIRLHPDYWTLNNGSKFLYNHQTASLLDDIRAQRVPVDFLELFDAAKVPFYEGCMIVELLDFRPAKATDPVLETPDKSRVVLTPNGETLWTDICLMNEKAGHTWTDAIAMEVESRILLATAPPLCLDPDPHLSRMVNSVLRISVPTAPPPLKRKAAVMELEEEETERARRTKLMQFMNPKNTRAATPNFRILEAIQRAKNPMPQMSTQIPNSASPHPVMMGPGPGSVSMSQGGAAASPYPPAPIGIPAPIPTPTPPVNTPQIASAQLRRTESGQSPRLGTGPGTPISSTVMPPAAAHIMQSHYPQHATMQTPSSSSVQSPRPPSTAISTPSPGHPDTRPSSRSQPGPQQPLAQAGPMQTQQPNTVMQHQPIATPRPPPMPATSLQQQGGLKRKAAQSSAVNTKSFATFSQAGTQAQGNPQAVFYYQHAALQQRQNQAAQSQGSSPAARSPMPVNQAIPQQSSPLAATQPLTSSRSPMPPTNAQQQAYNFAMYHQNPGAAHMRAAMPHGMPQHHLVSGGQAAGQQGQLSAQDQAHNAQLMAQYSMYYAPARMGVNMQPGMAGNYWQVGAGRGGPVGSGQHAAMGGHAQQMHLAPGKAVQGGGT